MILTDTSGMVVVVNGQARCIWKEMTDQWADPFYGTSCGNSFEFQFGNVRENYFVFCPYCGKKIEEAQP